VEGGSFDQSGQQDRLLGFRLKDEVECSKTKLTKETCLFVGGRS